MTDSAISGATRAQPPGIQWIPIKRAGSRPPQVQSAPISIRKINDSTLITVVRYGYNDYPSLLVILFTIFGIISIVLILALLAAPIYATRTLATLLLFGLAIGLGGTACTVARAARIASQR